MQILENSKKAYLLLADGTVFEGLSVGAQGTTIGEVCLLYTSTLSMNRDMAREIS